MKLFYSGTNFEMIRKFPDWFGMNYNPKLPPGRFSSKEEVIAKTDAYFYDLPKSYFLDGLKTLEKRLSKCRELKGDYVEKKVHRI